MAETHMINQLKFRITSLETQLHDKQKRLEEYQTIQSEADSKIKALNKVHADKVRNLLNSIQILKKEKASLEGQSKQHKRSKLIEQLNKEIGDQDLAIEVLRKFIYDDKGKEKGRQICDEVIIKALTKGPQRIRPLSRQELRMEIDKLKSINIILEGKLKNRGNNQTGRGGQNILADDISQVSTVSQQSFVNHDEQMLRRMRDLQFENQNLKLQINAKLKIIEQMKLQLKQNQKLKIDLEIAKNEQEIAGRKLKTLENLMKETKQHTNNKIIELYERQIKVEELEIISKENSDKLKQAHQNHNLLSEEAKVQKQQLVAQIQALKSENQQLILENIANKKRLDELKKIIKDMDQLNSKQKQDLKGKVNTFQKELEKLIIQNKKLSDSNRQLENTLFQERAEWVDQKAKLISQLNEKRENAASKQLIGKYMQDISDLKDQNDKLKSLLESGGGGDDKILLQRLEGYKRKLEFYQSKGDKGKQRQYYDELFKKYNELAEQFEEYKRKYGPKHKQAKRKNYIEINRRQESQYQNMSSGISKLGLEEIDSDILDNFDSSYEYEMVVNEFGQKVKMPRLTDADKELLKLMTSDLWGFVTDEKMDKKIQQAASFYVFEDDQEQEPVDYVKMRQLKNLSNPRGKKVVMYEEQINQLNKIDDSVSITSALEKQLNKFSSDVDIEMKKMPKGVVAKNINSYNLKDMSLSVDGLSSMSSAKQGESNLGKKKKVQDKGSRISIGGNKKVLSDKSSEILGSQIESSLLDSDVSSNGIRESDLASINSDIQINFKKKK